MKVRIGIDVGGTFTDAVAIDNETFELVGSVKVPTTHKAAEGVAAGIVQALHRVMDECSIKPEDVVFIAHGTTQATNALLEGMLPRSESSRWAAVFRGQRARAIRTWARLSLLRVNSCPLVTSISIQTAPI